MTSVYPKCFDCARFRGSNGPAGYRCDAFAAIPAAILINQHDHCEPYPGDGGVRFEPAETAIQYTEKCAEADRAG